MLLWQLTISWRNIFISSSSPFLTNEKILNSVSEWGSLYETRNHPWKLLVLPSSLLKKGKFFAALETSPIHYDISGISFPSFTAKYTGKSSMALTKYLKEKEEKKIYIKSSVSTGIFLFNLYNTMKIFRKMWLYLSLDLKVLLFV